MKDAFSDGVKGMPRGKRRVLFVGGVAYFWQNQTDGLPFFHPSIPGWFGISCALEIESWVLKQRH